jgi:bis(5'-adenosyl)-triphosphatase
MSKDEISDLYNSVQVVGRVIEREFKGEALTISMQDGKAAGQSVFHVHVHILPRKPGDLQNNDDLYPMLEENGKTMSARRGEGKSRLDDENRKPRSLEEMWEESKFLRQFFDGSENIDQE